MAELFGLDIAGLVGAALKQAGGLQPGTLIRSNARHAMQGFLSVQEVRLPGTGVVEPRPVLSVLGGSLPQSVAPQVNDAVELGGIEYELVRLVRSDPAGALYEFEAR